MPEAAFECWRCKEFVRADLVQDEYGPDLYHGQCPGCGTVNVLVKPAWGPQGINKGMQVELPKEEAPDAGRASLLEHLIGILEPAKRDVRAFLSDEDLPEELFVISQNVWNYLDRALKKAKELA